MTLIVSTKFSVQMLPRSEGCLALFKPLSTADVHDILDAAEERWSIHDPATRGTAPFRWAIHDRLVPWISEYMERDLVHLIGKFSLRPGKDRMLLATPSHVAQPGAPLPADFGLRWTLVLPIVAGDHIDTTPYQPSTPA